MYICVYIYIYIYVYIHITIINYLIINYLIINYIIINSEDIISQGNLELGIDCIAEKVLEPLPSAYDPLTMVTPLQYNRGKCYCKPWLT